MLRHFECVLGSFRCGNGERRYLSAEKDVYAGTCSHSIPSPTVAYCDLLIFVRALSCKGRGVDDPTQSYNQETYSDGGE